ncbi:MAG: ammonia-forming cytochrome c nitrite reductase subunit c552 [Verrucomicrobia bacterium]|nr:ammonia-forming cytochrome c nitrite reductase subunit c552 [Verrucomicrobiota bacterium]
MVSEPLHKFCHSHHEYCAPRTLSILKTRVRLLFGEIKAARSAGATDEELAAPRDFQRKAQFYLDFIEAENSMGFHAPQEAVRILGESINFSRKGQMALRKKPDATKVNTQSARQK